MNIEKVISNIDEEKKREIIVTDTNKNLFVEAGAGAGKTTLIVSRILNQLKHGTLPERIVVITFTNLATRELQGRIMEAVTNALEAADINENEKANLENAVANIDRMQISTIHSFCHRILSEKCFEAELAVDFKLMSSEEEEAAFKRFFVQWMEKNIGKSEWEQLQRKVTKDKDKKSLKRSTIADYIYKMAQQIYTQPSDVDIKVVAWGDKNVPNAQDDTVISKKKLERKVPGDIDADKEIDTYIKNIEAEFDKIVKKIPMAVRDGKDHFKDLSEDYLTAFGKEVAACFKQNDEDALKIKMQGIPSTTAYVIKVSKKDLEAYYKEENEKKEKKEEKLKVKELKEKANTSSIAIENEDNRLKTLAKIYVNHIYSVYVQNAKKCADDYKKVFPSFNATNDLLLQKTRQLLDEHPEVKEYFSDKFDCYYVDEFQDTDHVQADFIKMLAEDKSNPGNPRDGALFLVGDPKQSIYRFRGAEPEVYFENKDWMENLPNAYVISLNNNYRSNSDIINWVNEKFLNKNITDGTPYVEMVCADEKIPEPKFKDNEKALLIKGIYKYKEPEILGRPKDAILADADAVCNLIKKMVGKYKIIDKERDKDNKIIKVVKTIEYKHFLVLCGEMDGMDIYAEEFRKNGIPYEMSSKTYGKLNYYVNAFIRMYAYLSDPYDKTAKEGALEVLAFTGAIEKDKNIGILENLKKMTYGQSAYGCLQFLLKHLELIIPKNTEIDAYETSELTTKLTQMTENVKAQDSGSRLDVLGKLKEYAENKLERELVMKEENNAVRFMNLHKAKGLEGEIVIWTNRQENRKFSHGRYISGNEYFPDASNAWYSYCGDVDLEAKAEREAGCEHIRLEYVAATRAKQALIFMDSLISTKTKNDNYFIEGYGLTGLPSIEECFEPDESETKTDSNAVAAAPYPITALDDEINARKYHLPQATHLFLSESPSDYEDKSRDSSSDDSKEGSVQRPKGRVIGLAMHRTFELMVERRKGVNEGFDEKKISEFCMRQALNEMRPEIPDGEYEAYHKFLVDAVGAFVEWVEKEKIYEQAEEVYTELPFSYKKEGEDDIPVWMHGEADLIIKCNDGNIRLYDYKSDDDTEFSEQDFEAKLQRKYSPQVRAYKEMISSLFRVDEDRISAQLLSFTYKSEGKMRIRVTEIK